MVLLPSAKLLGTCIPVSSECSQYDLLIVKTWPRPFFHLLYLLKTEVMLCSRIIVYLYTAYTFRSFFLGSLFGCGDLLSSHCIKTEAYQIPVEIPWKTRKLVSLLPFDFFSCFSKLLRALKLNYNFFSWPLYL